MFPGDIDSSMKVLIVGITTLKGDWELKFREKDTFKAAFTDDRNQVLTWSYSNPGVGNLWPAEHFYQAHFFRSMCVKNRHT